LVSLGLFSLIRMGAGPAPGTMNKEYQEATNEYLKVRSPYSYRFFLLGPLRGRGKMGVKMDEIGRG
jgi:hypothetical protein